MRLKAALRKTLAAALHVSLAFWIGSCSSSQQQGEELENSNQEETGEVAQQGAQGEEAAQGQGGDEENVAYEENIGEQDDYMAEGGDAAAEGDAMATDATENELQDVISQMNQESNGTETTAEVLNPAADATNMASAPMNGAAPMNAAATAAPMGAAPTAGSMGGLPEMNSKMPYIVQKGDTLGKIARKIYGDMNRWSEIKELSALNDPNRIYPGDIVYYALTAESTAFAQAYELAPRLEVTVQQGQTLANIAAQVYGDSETWKTIWRQNGHISNPDRLEVGTVIYYIDQAALFTQIGSNGSTTALASQTATNATMTLNATAINSANHANMQLLAMN